LRELTDARVKHLQCRWLDQNGWVYTVSRMGNPKVLRAFAEKKLGLDSARLGADEPDFSAWTAA